MLGYQRDPSNPVLAPRKITDWQTKQEVLGFTIDTHHIRILIPSRKIRDIHEILSLRPTHRDVAQAREAWSLTGKLRNMATIILPGRYFIWRLLFISGTDRRNYEDHEVQIKHGRQIVHMSPEFHHDLDWWKQAVDFNILERGLSLYSPVFPHVSRPVVRHWMPDASTQAIGGYCPDISTWWRYVLSPDEVARTLAVWQGPRNNAIDINLLELLGMVMTAWTISVTVGDWPRS